MHGPSPYLKFWGDRPPVPPRSPPLHVVALFYSFESMFLQSRSLFCGLKPGTSFGGQYGEMVKSDIFWPLPSLIFRQTKVIKEKCEILIFFKFEIFRFSPRKKAEMTFPFKTIAC